jgi:hypothetical protein
LNSPQQFWTLIMGCSHMPAAAAAAVVAAAAAAALDAPSRMLKVVCF